jgi:glutamate racemase
LVLGCTHYPLVANIIAQSVGAQVQILEPGEAVARRLREVLDSKHLIIEINQAAPKIELLTLTNIEHLNRAFAYWVK